MIPRDIIIKEIQRLRPSIADEFGVTYSDAWFKFRNDEKCLEYGLLIADGTDAEMIAEKGLREAAMMDIETREKCRSGGRDEE